jgi:hypothetical protein
VKIAAEGRVVDEARINVHNASELRRRKFVAKMVDKISDGTVNSGPTTSWWISGYTIAGESGRRTGAFLYY